LQRHPPRWANHHPCYSGMMKTMSLVVIASLLPLSACMQEGDDPVVPPAPAPLAGARAAPPLPSYPDVAMELVLPVPCGSTAVTDAVINAMHENFPPQAGQPPVLADFLCVSQNHGRVGLWFRFLTADEGVEARHRALASMDITQGSETVGLRLPERSIVAAIERAYLQQPTDFDHDGHPADGPVHLVGHGLELDPAHKSIAFYVDGVDDSATPDLYFTVKQTDTFSLLGGGVQCSSEVDLSKDELVHWAAGATLLVTAFLSPWIAPLAVVFSGAFFAEGTIISSVHAPASLSSSFCDIVGYISHPLLLRGVPGVVAVGQKLTFDLSRVSVAAPPSSEGISLAGTWAIVARQPRVLAGGTVDIDVTAPVGFTGGTLQLSARATAGFVDMITPTFTWTATGATLGPITSGPAGEVRTLTWAVPNVHIGDTVTRTFTVSAVDDEGLHASGSSSFRFHIKRDTFDDPDICDKRPHLPQCSHF
jgi:hypothetical protein